MTAKTRLIRLERQRNPFRTAEDMSDRELCRVIARSSETATRELEETGTLSDETVTQILRMSGPPPAS